MNVRTIHPGSALPALLTILLIAGCSGDERVARVATQAADRQAGQNEEMARLNREVAEGTRRLVENDAQARKELVTVHQELQAERAELGQQWNALETERKQIATQRRTESLLVPAFQAAGLALLAALVVGFCWTVLFGLRRSAESDTDVSQLLIQEIFLADEPRRLPADTSPNRERGAQMKLPSPPDGSENPESPSQDSQEEEKAS